MSTFLTIIGIIIGVVLVFVLFGLLGWGVQAIAAFFGLMGDGITGCIGCFVRFFWYILVIIIAIGLIVAL